MKASSLIFILLILIITKSISQKYETGVYGRIDTIVTLDLDTNIEEVKIVKSMNVYIDADNCETLPKEFSAKTTKAEVAQVKELTDIEFRCNGEFQREWEIESFNLVINKMKNAPRTITNLGSNFTLETKKVLSEMNSGELIAFEQITLLHPKKGLATVGFSLQIK
ncbi:MAG: hypothetical protein M3Q56_07835 [Bacteroidota bacterium]|nr:hypothetical protein [Bacteroidota bacterium]